MSRLKLLIALAGLGSLGLSGAALAAAAHTSASSTVVSTRQTSLGTILVTGSGRTLYLNTADKPPHFACTAGCLKAWPPLKAVGTLKATGAAKSSLLGTTNGPAGKTVTYNHHPLYTFVSDSTNNPTSGEGLNNFYAVNAAGNKVPKPSKKKPSSQAPGY
jgi:predicted lipoprotein with Yx(FWY)xxD motif